jgi:hypothetical protein
MADEEPSAEEQMCKLLLDGPGGGGGGQGGDPGHFMAGAPDA